MVPSAPRGGAIRAGGDPDSPQPASPEEQLVIDHHQLPLGLAPGLPSVTRVATLNTLGGYTKGGANKMVLAAQRAARENIDILTLTETGLNPFMLQQAITETA